MYEIPSISKAKENKKMYHSLLSEYAQINKIDMDEEKYKKNLRHLQNTPFYHQITFSSDCNAGFEGIIKNNKIFTSKNNNTGTKGMTMSIDSYYNLDEYFYYTKGRPRDNKANESIVFAYNPDIFWEDLYPNAFFSNDLIEILNLQSPNNFYTESVIFTAEDKDRIWEQYIKTILTIEDGIEILAKLITLKFGDFKDFVISGENLNLGFGEELNFFQPEFKIKGDLLLDNRVTIYCLMNDVKEDFLFLDKGIFDKYQDKFERVTIYDLATS